MGFTENSQEKKPHRELFKKKSGKKKKKKKRVSGSRQAQLAFASGADKASLEIDLTGDDEEGAHSRAPPESSYETSSYDVDMDQSKQSSEGKELSSNISE